MRTLTPQNCSALRPVAILLLLVGLTGCGGGSDDNSNASFNGINQTYVLSGGNRKLQLEGLRGHYSAVTFAGMNSLEVILKQHTISIGGNSFPYIADKHFFQGGGYVGYSSAAVIDDPGEVGGRFNTLTGANFLGQLNISSPDRYLWCQRSNLNGSGGCTDGTAPLAGRIVPVPGVGFKLTGISGMYAAFHDNSAAAIFPADSRGLNLKGVSQTTAAPNGTFSQTLIATSAEDHIVRVSFSNGNKLTIEGIRNFDGTYSFTYSNGAISFASSACRSGTCNGIYNDKLRLVYLAQIGDAIFFKL